MNTITLYGFAPSTYTRTARMAAIELGVPVELKPIEFKKASHYALHPYGKMPALEHGETRVFETLAIAAYLDAKFGPGTLLPADAVARARTLQWTSAAIDYVYDDLVDGLHAEPAPRERVAAAAQQLEMLNVALDRSMYFGGEHVTLCDLFLFPMVGFAAAKMGPESVARLDALSAWTKRMGERPSAQETA